ncbi:MAG: glycosyltransferase family 4 protein [Thiotrichaceae bacterium]
MKIVHVSGATGGGAGIAACRLHAGLRALDVDSRVLVNKLSSTDDYIVAPNGLFDKAVAELVRRLDGVPGRLSSIQQDLYSSSLWPNRLIRRIDELSPDIVNLHWVNGGMLRIESLPKIQAPVVWTLHDMWPFSGSEHYVGDCQRYQDGYLSSNRPIEETRLDVNRWIWKRKKKSWQQTKNLIIAAPSKWMAECASNSVLFGERRIEVLPNGLDHERFRPMDHAVVRRILGLPEDKKLILFGAGSATSDKRKGFHLLVEALKKLETQVDSADYELVVFGSSSGDTSFSMNTHYLGRLADEISIALVYAAADVFVAPSLEDNLPNTVLESLSCGTPVVAFNIGGFPDMVNHQENGYLAAGFDTAELANGLQWVLNDQQRWKKLSENARETVLSRFTLEHSASRYRDLYEEILDAG